MSALSPLVFQPILKRIRWGGRRLGEVLGKEIGEAADYAESWELVDHGVDQSIVTAPSESSVRGWTLKRLVEERSEDLFGESNAKTQFPLLIKFLDASDRLSVQVHPDDALARKFDPTENGKTEAWVILDAEPGALLYAGLKTGVTESDLRAALANESVEALLHTIEVKAGDCVFIPAGTIHAIGEGVLLAEVQQASDMTFRLYDWGRVGADGQPRQLHIEESVQATNWERGPVDPVAPVPLPGGGERLVECSFFSIDRHTFDGSHELAVAGYARVLIGLDGDGQIPVGDSLLPCGKGDTVLVPAGVSAEVRGQGAILEVACV